ncbi:MAG: hypothetical protein LBT42_08875 [Tannerella sp.]|jgi:hypothetical protein|nr:hypothetical protein [Tannerella sp.]
MKKIVYQKLYDYLSALSNRFNYRFLSKCKIILGLALLALMGCSKEEYEEEPELMCYDSVAPQEVVEKGE